MGQFLLSTYAIDGVVLGAPTPAEKGAFLQRIIALESEMDASGTLVFAGSLSIHDPDAATVVSVADGEVVATKGPFADSPEAIAGFYIINADDLDSAVAWAGKVAAASNRSIEVRPFGATGRVADWVSKV